VPSLRPQKLPQALSTFPCRANIPELTAFAVSGKTLGVNVMTVRTYFAIFAVLSVLFGIGFVLAPGQVLINYGIADSPPVALMGRLFGGTLLAIAMIQWSARDFSETTVRPVLIALCIGDVVGLVVSTMATMAGTINAMGWSTVLIYLCGALGAGYFLTAGSAQRQAA
jgi:hypothetical protein